MGCFCEPAATPSNDSDHSTQCLGVAQRFVLLSSNDRQCQCRVVRAASGRQQLSQPRQGGCTHRTPGERQHSGHTLRQGASGATPRQRAHARRHTHTHISHRCPIHTRQGHPACGRDGGGPRQVTNRQGCTTCKSATREPNRATSNGISLPPIVSWASSPAAASADDGSSGSGRPVKRYAGCLRYRGFS
eukprot:COSAG01_NODE_2203_length_8173_cov_8.387293_7_plen_189_part_00